MAIVYVHENYVNQAPSGASLAINPATAVAAGNHAICFWGANSATTATLSTSASGATAQTNVIVGTGTLFAIGSIYAPNGIATSDTITFGATSGVLRGIIIEEFSGLLTSGWFDASANSPGTSTAGGACAIGPSGTTSQASELVTAGVCIATTGKTWTKDAAYSLFTTGTAGFGTATRQSFAEYQIVSATGTQSATPTFSTGAAVVYSGAIATFKGAARTPRNSTININDPGFF
jgi:hypothetical protein